MNGMAQVFKNNVYRMMNRKAYLLLTLSITIAVMALAIYLTSALEMKGRIAVVGEPDSLPANVRQAYKVEPLDAAPPKSQLVRNKYDAVLTDQGNGSYSIEAIKGEPITAKLEQALAHPDRLVTADGKRGVGTNILGFLVMVILLEGFLFMTFFPEDKANGTFRRMLTSPVRAGSYLFAQCLFCWIIVYVPTFGLMAAASQLLHIDIGLGLLQYAWLLGLLALVATAFALFMSSWIENSDQMMTLAGSLILLTSLLSGSFYSFTPEGGMKWLVAVLPQKQFLTVVQALEREAAMEDWAWSVGYLLLLSGLFFLAGWGLCRKRLAEGRY
ncbi:ABC-type transport system involved in multi-copper enzyme maturation, permease component [Chlamydia abortus]|uniref:ABC transporter permease n=1 Tax=Paenibacillus residui TaxID=629724 RepID=A0ABW3D995_9BACL|nr:MULTISPECIES: ABC transporter permease [Paenibacillaceae]SHE10882.1 ABC-type transport system involved in multi-copper enzyme maturation, permease component [Chlamydia abortus]